MKKLYRSKTFLKMGNEWMHTFILPLDPSLAMSYRNHQKSPTYFNHLAPSVLLFFTRKPGQKGGGGTRRNAPLNTLLPRSLRLRAWERIICLFK